MEILYREEIAYIEKLKSQIENGDLQRDELEHLLEKFREMTEMTSVTVKMIDRIMKNYDKLKQEKVTSNGSKK